MKLKKVIFFHPSFERGGVEKIIINLINYLTNKKFKVVLISSKKKVNLENLHQVILKKKSSRMISAIIASFYLMKYLISNFKERNKICILSLQSNSMAIILSKLFGFKVAIRNSEYPLGSLKYNDDVFVKTFLIFIQKIFFYNFADLIISNSNGSSKTIKQFIIKKKKVIYIYNPYLKEIKKENFNERKNNILFVGRLVKQKGIIYLLNAFKEFQVIKKNYVLYLVGSGPLKSNIKDFIINNKLENKIKIIDWKDKIDNFYQKSKCFILPSVYEGLGNVVIESLNNSTPCIVSNCRYGPTEIVDNKKGGIVFKNKSSKDLLDKMIFMDENYSECIERTKHSRKLLNRFIIDNQAKVYIENLNKIL